MFFGLLVAFIVVSIIIAFIVTKYAPEPTGTNEAAGLWYLLCLVCGLIFGAIVPMSIEMYFVQAYGALTGAEGIALRVAQILGALIWMRIGIKGTVWFARAFMIGIILIGLFYLGQWVIFG